MGIDLRGGGVLVHGIEYQRLHTRSTQRFDAPRRMPRGDDPRVTHHQRPRAAGLAAVTALFSVVSPGLLIAVPFALLLGSTTAVSLRELLERFQPRFVLASTAGGDVRFDGLLELCEEFLSEIIARVLDRCADDLERLERDISLLEPATRRPYPRIDYGDAVQALAERGQQIRFGDDFGGDDETVLASLYDRPVMVTRYPADIKAFYMQPDPQDPSRALAVDVLAPEGYGEIIGGSERSDSLEHLERQIAAHELPRQAFEWYLDVRRFGSFPHSGFGMGIERCVTWICGVPHLREAIPYPRMLNRLYP